MFNSFFLAAKILFHSKTESGAVGKVLHMGIFCPVRQHVFLGMGRACKVGGAVVFEETLLITA